MPTFDLGAWFGNEFDGVILKGIPSVSYPDGMDYAFPSPTAGRGIWMRDLLRIGEKVQAGENTTADLEHLATLDNAQERDLFEEVMGDALAEMVADGVPWAGVQQVFTLLLRHWGQGEGHLLQLIAQAAREAQATPKTPAKKTAARKAPAKKATAKAAN